MFADNILYLISFYPSDVWYFEEDFFSVLFGVCGDFFEEDFNLLTKGQIIASCLWEWRDHRIHRFIKKMKGKSNILGGRTLIPRL